MPGRQRSDRELLYDMRRAAIAACDLFDRGHDERAIAVLERALRQTVPPLRAALERQPGQR